MHEKASTPISKAETRWLVPERCLGSTASRVDREELAGGDWRSTRLIAVLNVTQSLVNIVWSYATLKWYRKPIMDSVEVEILARLQGSGRCDEEHVLYGIQCIHQIWGISSNGRAPA